MIDVLIRLQWMTLRGRVVRWTRLLRQPKYLVGSLIGACWMLFWAGRPLLHADVSVHFVQLPGLADELGPVVQRLAGVVITAFLTLQWLLPWGRLGLPFREAELTLLLQAPLTRRQVIRYGLLKSALGVLIGSFFFSIFLGAGGPLDRLRLFGGVLLLFTFWELNSKWRAMFLLRQREVSPAVARTRRAFITVGLGALLLALAAGVLQLGRTAFEQLRGTEAETILAGVGALSWPPLLLALSAPARWLAGPAVARDWLSFFWAALPVLALIVVQRELVLRTPARFEEVALAQARDLDTKKSPTRRFKRASSWGRRQQVFALRPDGPPALGVLWKNLMRVSRVPLARAAVAVAVLLVVLAVLPALLRGPETVYAIMIVLGLVSAVATPMFGGMSWSNDLRTEFAHIEMVRTWPVSARRFVAAQVASPATLGFLTACCGLGLALAGFLGSRLRMALLDLPSRIEIGGPSLPLLGSGSGSAILILAGVVPVVAGAAFVSSAMQNLVVLLVPAWMAQGPDANKGIAAFGQRLVFSLGIFLGFVLALVPSAILVGLAALAQWGLGLSWTVWIVPVWGLLAALPLFVETWLLVTVAARLWEDLDPSEEVLESGR